MIKRDFALNDISNRALYRTGVEGGALNANYRTVDVIARIGNACGKAGLSYGKNKDWYWDDRTWVDAEPDNGHINIKEGVRILFAKEEYATIVELSLERDTDA